MNMSDKELTEYIKNIKTSLMEKLKEQIGFIPEFKRSVASELEEVIMKAAIGELDEDEAVDTIWEQVFDLSKYEPEGRWYRKDAEGEHMTSFGFILTRDGTFYHLTDQFCHGTVIAALDPIHAMSKGYVHPTKLLNVGVFEYQDYELSGGGKELGFLRFACGWSNCLSGDFPTATQEQLQALKKYFQRFDMMDFQLTTDRVIYKSGRDFVKDLDRILFDVKMGIKNVEQDVTLCELHVPEDNPLGEIEGF